MDRKHSCLACEAQRRGVKSRIALNHTCKEEVQIWGRSNIKQFKRDETERVVKELYPDK